jgi:hypothetical protein
MICQLKKIFKVSFLVLSGFCNQLSARNLSGLSDKPSIFIQDAHVHYQKNHLENTMLVTRYLSAQEKTGAVYQILLHFQKPIECEKTSDPEKSTITLYFPGMRLKDFEAKSFKQAWSAVSYVKDVQVTQETTPINRIAMTINFVPDSAIVKIQKRASPYILSIDCYQRDILEQIKNSTDILNMAYRAAHPLELPSISQQKKETYHC